MGEDDKELTKEELEEERLRIQYRAMHGYTEEAFFRDYKRASNKDRFINELENENFDYEEDEDRDVVEEAIEFYKEKGRKEFEKEYKIVEKTISNEQFNENLKELEKKFPPISVQSGGGTSSTKPTPEGGAGQPPLIKTNPAPPPPIKPIDRSRIDKLQKQLGGGSKEEKFGIRSDDTNSLKKSLYFCPISAKKSAKQ